MRRILLALMILSSALLYAEDIIITRSSEKISAIIEEVGPDYIKYHKKSDPKGPLFRLEAHEIATIIYGNGELQTFDAPAPVAPAANEPQLSQQQFFGQQPQQPNGYAQQPQPQYGYGYQPYPQQPFVDYKAIERHRKDSIKAEKKAAWKAHREALPHEHFLLVNYSFGFDKTHNVGLTYGWCHVGGVYVNAMLGLNGFNYKTAGGIRDADDYRYWGAFGGERHWQLTNTLTKQRISLVVGGMIRLKCPLYLMGGLGYSYRTRTYQNTEGKWIEFGYGGSGLAYQLGLLGQIKKCSLMASISAYNMAQLEALVGVGFAIEGKKGGKK